LAEVHHFSFWAVGPLLAVVSAAAGCLLGIILTTKAQKVSGATRVRLLAYASCSLGATTVWQANVLAMMGLGSDDYMVRLDPAALGGALVFAVASIGGGLFAVTSGRLGSARLAPAALMISLGVAGTHAMILGSIRVTGLSYHRGLLLTSIALALATGCGLIWSLVSLHRMRQAVIAGVAIGVALCASHYVGEYAVHVHKGQSIEDGSWIVGVTPLGAALPVAVFGLVLVAMMWFFTVGTATARDLQVIFTGSGQPAQIEPEMIEEVTARIAQTVWPEPPLLLPVFAPRRRGPAIIPIWRSLPVPRNAAPAVDRPVADPVERFQEEFAGRELHLEPSNMDIAARAKDRNTREHRDVRNSDERTLAIRRGSTVHRDAAPVAGVAPVSPAPVGSVGSDAAALPRRRPAVTLTDQPGEPPNRGRNRRFD
jgi:NO-binding membrane sensor protein with MHYT domain